jgi:hypothetical protein
VPIFWKNRFIAGIYSLGKYIFPTTVPVSGDSVNSSAANAAVDVTPISVTMLVGATATIVEVAVTTVVVGVDVRSGAFAVIVGEMVGTT